jgi:hypothetical protein
MWKGWEGVDIVDGSSGVLEQSNVTASGGSTKGWERAGRMKKATKRMQLKCMDIARKGSVDKSVFLLRRF